MKLSVLIRPRDPLIFRDGKPFDAGLGAASINWPMPSTIAGCIRTRLWGSREFNLKAQDRLRQVTQTGPFLAVQDSKGKWELCCPAPADAAIYGSKGAYEIVPLRPTGALHFGEGSGSDLPEGMSPLAGSRSQKADESAPSFWTLEQTMKWLEAIEGRNWFKSAEQLGYSWLPQQSRLHVQMSDSSRNAAEGMLFRTTSLEFEFASDFRRKERRAMMRPTAAMGIYSQVHAEDGDWSNTDGVGPMGAEQRVSVWTQGEELLPLMPESWNLLNLIRLQLVTPGVFGDGWKPAWADSGEPPGCPGLRLRLVSAAVRRAIAVSGFDMAKSGEDRLRPTRMLAPAGSVYFFAVEQGDPRSLWMRSISDEAQDRRDGFGIVLIGGWKWR